MKNGYMFFFNLGNITKVSRIVMVFALCGLINFGISEIMFWVCAAVAVVCFSLNLFHSPTDKDFMNALADFREGFEKELGNRHGIMSMDNVARTEGFVKNKRMLLKRRVDKKIIYPCPAILAAIELHGEVMVFAGRISMLKKNDPQYVRCDLDKDMKIEGFCEEGDPTAIITLSSSALPGEITVAVPNDYHYRAFMDKVGKRSEEKK